MSDEHSDVTPLLLVLRPGPCPDEESYDAYRERIMRENAEVTKELGELFAAYPMEAALLAFYGAAALDLLPDNHDTKGFREGIASAFKPLIVKILHIAPGLESSWGSTRDFLGRNLTAKKSKS